MSKRTLELIHLLKNSAKPRSTKYEHLKLLKAQLRQQIEEEQQQKINQPLQLSLKLPPKFQIQPQELQFQNNDAEIDIDHLTEDVINKVNNDELQEDELNQELNQVFKYGVDSEEVISAVLLTVFFIGRLTQSAFAITLSAFSLLSNTYIPKSFDTLAACLNKDGYNDAFEKLFYCDLCQISLQKLNTRFERRCICGTRYVLYIYKHL